MLTGIPTAYTEYESAYNQAYFLGRTVAQELQKRFGDSRDVSHDAVSEALKGISPVTKLNAFKMAGSKALEKIDKEGVRMVYENFQLKLVPRDPEQTLASRERLDRQALIEGLEQEVANGKAHPKFTDMDISPRLSEIINSRDSGVSIQDAITNIFTEQVNRMDAKLRLKHAKRLEAEPVPRPTPGFRPKPSRL